MSVLYFNSNKIKVYPVSHRDITKYRESRVSTEHNVSESLNKALSRSYIVEGLTIANNKLSSGKAVIGGYMIEIAENNGLTISGSNNQYLCLTIRIDRTLGNGELVSMDNTTTVDDSSGAFCGVFTQYLSSFAGYDPKTLSKFDGDNDKYLIYILPIAKKTASGWDNLYCDENNTEDRVYGKKYLANDVLMSCAKNTNANYGTEHPTPLDKFLESYLVIDDGVCEETD